MAFPAQSYQRTPEPGNTAQSARSGHALGRAVARDSQLLDQLDGLKFGLLTGTLPRNQLSELARLAASHRSKIDDPRLASLLDEIDLRAQVELAKLAAAS